MKKDLDLLINSCLKTHKTQYSSNSRLGTKKIRLV